jgi:mono/diheme cytochrome c family protein
MFLSNFVSYEVAAKKTAGEVLSGVSQIVFAVRADGIDPHWYANFGYYADNDQRKPAPNNGGKLCIYDMASKQVRVLLDDPEGSVRDPQVDYDATKILFSYRAGTSSHFHLYEIKPDGSGLKQLTDGDCDDIEPTYTADDKIIFVSSRAKRWVQCWLTPVAILYGCDLDGKNIHALSGNVEHDNTPWPLPNGQILYTRWEYVDRSQVHYHHLWTMFPDGTRQMVYYGNMHPGTVFIDAKPVPGSDKVVAIFSWGHGRTEHVGPVGIIDPRSGPDEQSAAKKISRNENYRDPWAFSETAFMASQDARVVFIDGEGNEQVIYELPAEWRERNLRLQEPRPVMPREREHPIASTVNPANPNGRLILMDVYQGRNMAGVKRGEIKKLLILETLPKPINFTGGMEPLTYGGSFTLERVVGTVPVDPDGSANFELPAMRSFFFVALDENDRSVKRMQSFLSVMPGEISSCIGCHEQRDAAPQRDNAVATALRRPPSPITPVADFRGMDACGYPLAQSTGIPDVLDFTRDIQPILDERCVACHSPEKRSGGVSLVGHRTPLYTVSYYNITARGLVADGRNMPKSNYPPRTLGSSASRLLMLADGKHHGVKLDDREKTLLRLWIETGATYLGTYAGLGNGMLGGYAENNQDKSDEKWPETMAMKQVIQQTCIACHAAGSERQLPLTPSDETVAPPWEPYSEKDARRRLSRNLVYDLTLPEQSTLLLAPLAKNAGGYESCGKAVFKDKHDPRYKTILAGIKRAKQYLDEVKRFDMEGFVPRPQYIREMKKYGVLPPEHNPATVVDTYELEQRYWRSLWYQPTANK